MISRSSTALASRKLLAARLGFVAGVSFLLSACATGPTRFSEVSTNPDAILAKDFTAAYVSPALMTKLRASGLAASKPYKEVTFKLNYYSTRIGDREESLSHPQVTFRPIGDGLFQEIRDLENNGYLASRALVLSWAGIYSLKRDQASVQSQWAIAGNELKDVTPFKFNPVALAPGDSVTFEAKIGPRPQLWNLITFKSECKVDKITPGTQLHEKVQGRIVWFDCEATNDSNAAAKSKSKFVFLLDYGMALYIGFTDAAVASRTEVADFIVKTH